MIEFATTIAVSAHAIVNPYARFPPLRRMIRSAAAQAAAISPMNLLRRATYCQPFVQDIS